MNFCQQLINSLAAEYKTTSRNRYHHPDIKLHLSKGASESYTSKYAAGILSIEACNLMSQAYGIAQLDIALKAGHTADYLGRSSPKFALRPLWLESEVEVVISELTSVYLPKFMLDSDFSEWIPKLWKRMVQLGFNAIIVGSRTSLQLKDFRDEKINLQEIILRLNECGIQVIVKPNFLPFQVDGYSKNCPFNEQFREVLKEAIKQFFLRVPACRQLFWESMLLYPFYRFHAKAQDLTEVEIVLEELKLLETALSRINQSPSKHLIFYVPSTGEHAGRQSNWLLNFLDDVGLNTSIAFSAVAGDFCHDHLSDHPFWKQLRYSPDSSSTPLLPIINFGAVEQGEGLWPITNFDLIDRFLVRCRRHPFAGIIGIVNKLPVEGSLLDCLLWVAGQSMWRDMSPMMLAETWFAAFRQGESFEELGEILKAARRIALEVSSLRTLEGNEERRRIGEPLVAQLKSLINFYEKWLCKLDRPSLKEYFILFAADIRQFLEQFLQLSCRTSFGTTLGVEEPILSFWTLRQGRGDFLTKPQLGPPGSTMEAIYNENRFL